MGEEDIMAYRYKRFYLWGSVSIVVILALISPYIEYYYGYEKETYCGGSCIVDFCLKNGNRNLYFYNKDELPLTFYPEDLVSNVKFFKKDGRYKSGYRPIDFISPYFKGRLYVFKIDAYKPSCYRMKIEKEWWADVEWTFGKLDPMLISGKEVGDKIVKELCVPLYKTWTDEIKQYTVCTNCYNQTVETNETDKGSVLYPNGTYYKVKETCFNYSCLDYIEKIEHINEQVDCIKTGIVNVSGKIYEGENAYCKLDGTKICCYSNKEGGRYAATWRTDGSVDKECEDLITGKTELISSSGKRFIK